MKIKLTILTVLVSIGLFVPFIATSAQESDEESTSSGLALWPAIAELPTQPGESTLQPYQVQNISDEPLAVVIEPVPLLPIDREVDPERRGEVDASTWVELDETRLVFEPDEIKQIDATITVPENATAGTHTAAIGFRVANLAANSDGTSAVVQPELMAQLLISIPGDTTEGLEFVDTNDGSRKRLIRGNEEELKFTIRNTSPVHSVATPRVSILNSEGNEVAAEQLKPILVLPNSERDLFYTWKTDVPYGDYSAKLRLVYATPQQSLASSDLLFRVWPNTWTLVAWAVGALIILLALITAPRWPKAYRVLRGRESLPVRKLSKDDEKFFSKSHVTGFDPKTAPPVELPPQDEIETSPDDKEDKINHVLEAALAAFTPKEQPQEKKPNKPITQKSPTLHPTKATHKPQSKLKPQTEKNDGSAIIQTSASTIIREGNDNHIKKPPLPPAVERKITVKEHIEEPKPEPKKKPSKPKKIKVTDDS